MGLVFVFDVEEDMLVVFEEGKIWGGEVIVIWYEGLKGGFGMFEMLIFMLVLMGVGLGDEVVLLIDGCFFGGLYGFIIGYVILEV